VKASAQNLAIGGRLLPMVGAKALKALPNREDRLILIAIVNPTERR
jgi:hypothetical protein